MDDIKNALSTIAAKCPTGEQYLDDLVNRASTDEVPAVVALLLEACASPSWAVKRAILMQLSHLSTARPAEISLLLPAIIPVLTPMVWEAKQQVAKAAIFALTNLYQTIANRDVEPYVPALLRAQQHPDEIAETIHVLSSIVFVQAVRAPALAVLVPLLLRGFAVRQTAIRRKCCLICENMCKLVDDPEDIRVFLPQLEPCVAWVMNEVADPECRGVAARVRGTLGRMLAATKKEHVKEEYYEDEGDELLCECKFSLAYGTRILLNNTNMRLLKSKRYGVCGDNGCGKSTLMRAIVNDQVDGFPTRDVLRRVYVEHDIDGSHVDTSVVTYVAEHPSIAAMNLSVDDVRAALTSVGFGTTGPSLSNTVGSLSGGWKMKLALCRAMLEMPDVLLLDEPTNHLDVANVKWLEDYLNNTPVTCLIISHDSGFLDNVCTHVIYYQDLKLKTYRGNLAAFVEAHPEARSYYELGATPEVFKIAEPGFLEGVKTKDKAILKMHGVGFTYPGRDTPALTNASVYVSLSSRVACIGANAAGKSTLIKLLTGELEPNTGTVWKHPNLRIAYVAQHAFHHIEDHLDMSANEYIRWRYATGEDREAEDKVTRKIGEEERAALEAKLMYGGVKRQFEAIRSRRKLKKSYEYEVCWTDLSEDNNSWIEREDLVTLGFEKYVNEFDMKEATKLGLMSKPLTSANVERHLADLGMTAEIGTHNRIRGYSGGQKVRLVVAAATWLNPHVIVLDEPSNYLDRDSLGAFAAALKSYGGGVVVISHSREFLATIECAETWMVGDGRVVVEGAANEGREKVMGAPAGGDEEVIDAFGNTIKVKAPKKTNLSNKEKKAREKARKARRERGEDVSESEEDDA